MRGGKAEIFAGGFRDFAAPVRTAPPPPKKTTAHPPPKKTTAPPPKKTAPPAPKNPGRASELDALIASAEKQIAALREALKEDPAGDWAKLSRLATEEQALARRLETLVAERKRSR